MQLVVFARRTHTHTMCTAPVTMTHTHMARKRTIHTVAKLNVLVIVVCNMHGDELHVTEDLTKKCTCPPLINGIHTGRHLDVC